MKMVCGSFYIAKHKASKPQGEDAYFVIEEKQTIGVADGVGGWSKKGVDAGKYARELMFNVAAAINYLSEDDIIDPKEVLNEAYSKTHEEGSSTACILTLKNNHLHAANVGDSGFLLIREGEEIFKSPTQQRSFNHPYQLSKSKGTPNLAQEFKIAVEPGDVIIVGTDGLFDNLYTSQIKELLKVIRDRGGEPQTAAWAIAEHAYYSSEDKSAITPFMEFCFLAGKEYSGGKKDDITVIVAYVVHKEQLD